MRMRLARVVRTTAGCALAVGLTMPLTGCGLFGADSEPEIAADVAGREITSDRVNELFARFASTPEGAQALAGTEGGLRVSEEQVRANVLSYAIKLTFLEVLAEREGVSVPEPTEASEALFEEFAEVGSLQVSGFTAEDLQIAQHAEAIGKAIAAKLLPEVSISKQEYAEAYQERKALFDESFKSTTGIAFMDSADSAKQLRAALEDGLNFKAATKSVDTNVLAAETVDVNSLSSPIAPDLVDALAELEVGETSEPIELDARGTAVYVVMQQQARKDLPAVSLTEAKPDLTAIITNRRRKDVYDEWLRKQYLKADIRVDDYYGRWEPNLQAVI